MTPGDDQGFCCGACASAGHTHSDDERGAPLSAGHLVVGVTRRDAVSGGRDTRTVRLSSSTATLGRSAACDIRLDDARVSRVQCRLMAHNGQVWIEDAGSSCGTFVNGQRVTRTALHAADRVFIADFVLRISADDGSSDGGVPTP